jgi:serine/threonine-protein kinase
MPGRVVLSVVKGPIKGRTFAFDEHDTFIFGRADDCHARLPEQDETASRHHFILEVNPPQARIRDLGSLNGTYVNDAKQGGRSRSETPEQAAARRFPEVDLKHGDVIRVGETVFAVQVEISAACCDCGRPIPESERAGCEWIAGTLICAACRAKALKANQPPRKPEPLRCARCGKDVSAEVGPGRRGDYVCETCRGKAEFDPAALLAQLFQQHLAGASEQGPAQIPGYALGKMLGRGGMGAVYLARRRKDQAQVALKVMLSKTAVDEHSRAVFMREVEVTAALRHENIVRFFDHGFSAGVFYFVLEYCDGGSVDGLMKRRGGMLSLEEAGPIMLQSLDGLAFVHGKQFVHRDLKPQNLLLRGAEGRWTAKVADLGLAKNFAKAGYSGMTATGSYGGSFPFMPREQVTNFKYFKPVSDIWSIGATFYNMLTGSYPRDMRRGQDPMEAILKGAVVPIARRNPAIPGKLAEVIDQSLSNKPEERYRNAGEMRQALAKAL